jgi:drug/metabolite transporter (DMT)-like permease
VTKIYIKKLLMSKEDYKKILLSDFNNNINIINNNNNNKNLNLNLGKLYCFISNFVATLNIFVFKTMKNYNENYNRFFLNTVRFFILFLFSITLMKKKQIEILKKELKDKTNKNKIIENRNVIFFWHFIKIIFTFFSLFCWTYALNYIRISTAICIYMLHPILTDFLSVFFFNEKLQMKYLIGNFFSFFGCFLFIFSENENKIKENKNINNNKSNEIFSFSVFIGVFLNLLSALIQAITTISVKKLIKYNNSEEINLISGFFVGILSLVLGLIITRDNFILDFMDIKIFFLSCLCGFIMSLSYHYMNLSSEIADLSKISFVNYIQVILSILYGIIFYQEDFKFIDLISFLLIIGSNLYLSFKKDQ